MVFSSILNKIIMKVYLKITGVLLLFVFLQSCSPTQTISIKAKPGTIIYTPEMKRMAVIPDSGESEVEISKDVTYNYLLSQEKNGDKLVPFALNFENRNSNGPKVLEGICLGLAIPSTVAFLVGVALAVAEVDIITMIIGASVALPSAFIGMGASSRSNDDQYYYLYKYLPEQQTNQDIVFTPLKQTADYKTVSGKKYYKPSYEVVKVEEKEIKEQEKVYDNYIEQEENPVVKHNSDNAAPKNKSAQNVSSNYSQQVVGTYYGYGRLMSDNELVERYEGIKIVVSRRTDNMVKVDVFIRNNIPYFSSVNIYNISKTYNEYTLHHTTNDSYITIDENGNLNFTYKNIRNKGYVLKVTAEIE